MKKYLLYAVGEVLLVVVGILIALQINNWNEQRTQKNQLESILKNVASDLRQDTLTVNAVIQFYEAIDSASIKIMKGELTQDNFKECPLCPSIVTFYNPVIINQKGYDLLKNYSSDNFNENDTLVANIVQGHSQFITLFDGNNQRLEQTVTKNIGDFQKYSWYVDLMSGKVTKEFIDYVVSSEDYKKRVATQNAYAIRNQLAHVKLFRDYARKILIDLDERLNHTEIDQNNNTQAN